MKKILYFLLVLIIAVVIVIITLFDSFAKRGVESYVQDVLKTSVHVGEFRSDWAKGQLKLDFVEVKNPTVFNNENAFVLNHLNILLSDQTEDDLIVLEHVEFDGLLFTLEQSENRVNLVELLQKLNNQTGSKHSSIKPNYSSSASNQNNEQYRVIIKNLNFINAQLHVDTQWFKETLEVPDVFVRNLGAEQGIPIDQVGAELMKIALVRIQSEVEKQGLKLGEREIKEGLKRKLKSKLNTLSDDLDGKAKVWLEKLGL